MEFMILEDGSVRVYVKPIQTAWEVAEELLKQQGRAYFWPADEDIMHDRWFAMGPIFEVAGGDMIKREELPDIIKLTLML